MNLINLRFKYNYKQKKNDCKSRRSKDIFNLAPIIVVMEQNNIEEIRKKAERFESQFNKLKQEFKDYIETSRRNEETKRQELKIDSAKNYLLQRIL